MCEVFLIAKDERTSVGFAVVPVSNVTAGSQLPLYKGSARNLMLERQGDLQTVPDVKVTFAVERDSTNKFDGLEKLIRMDCLVRDGDTIPGLTETLDIRKFDKSTAFCSAKPLYLHAVSLSNLPLIESSFNQYLKLLCTQQGSNPQQPLSAEITERKLTVNLHNTWQRIGTQCMVSIVKDSVGALQPAGNI